MARPSANDSTRPAVAPTATRTIGTSIRGRAPAHAKACAAAAQTVARRVATIAAATHAAACQGTPSRVTGSAPTKRRTVAITASTTATGDHTEGIVTTARQPFTTIA